MSTELAWAAGFFDGEGCTSVQRGSNRLAERPRISISQKDRRTLDRFQAAVGGLGKIRSHGQRDIWQWDSRTVVDVWRVLKMLWPYLSAPKREQALDRLVDGIESKAGEFQRRSDGRRKYLLTLVKG